MSIVTDSGSRTLQVKAEYAFCCHLLCSSLAKSCEYVFSLSLVLSRSMLYPIVLCREGSLAPCAPDGFASTLCARVHWRQADCGGAELHVEFTVAGNARRGSERLLRGMAAVASVAGASELLSSRIARRGGTCMLYWCHGWGRCPVTCVVSF